MDRRLETRILSCPTLPSLPAVALEVLRLCRSDDIDLSRIAAAVSRDPALAAKLLRAANSVALAARGKVATLTRAVALLGSNKTLSISLSFSLVRSRRRGDATGFDHPAFWRRAVFSAIAGRALGEQTALDPEEVFLACLLQDLGMLALNEVFRLDYGPVYFASGGDHEKLVALEREALTVDHAEVGRLLASHWDLPESLQIVAQASHAPPVPRHPDADLQTLLECVFLSGRLADVWISPAPGEATRRALEAAEARLGFRADVMGAVLARMALAVPEAASDFEMDLGGASGVQAVLDEARTVLGLRMERSAEAPSKGDSATGLWPAEALESAAAGALDHARAHGHPLAAVLVAPDTAPALTDTQALGDLLTDCVRQTDPLGVRGDAYLALLMETPAGGALVVAERMRKRAEAAGIPVSVGVALHEPGAGFGTAERLLGAAERALDAARRAGGNRIARMVAGASGPLVEGAR